MDNLFETHIVKNHITIICNCLSTVAVEMVLTCSIHLASPNHEVHYTMVIPFSFMKPEWIGIKGDSNQYTRPLCKEEGSDKIN